MVIQGMTAVYMNLPILACGKHNSGSHSTSCVCSFSIDVHASTVQCVLQASAKQSATGAIGNQQINDSEISIALLYWSC